MTTNYNKQAEDFLQKHKIKFKDRLADTKRPPWLGKEGICGHHYRVTLSKQNKRITFDFFGSIDDAKAGQLSVTPYDVLACISGDVNCPETFVDYCDEYGCNTDSISALQDFRRILKFARKLRAFFTEQEIEDLQEIR